MSHEKLVMSLKGVVYERSNRRKTVWHNRHLTEGKVFPAAIPK
jgi:hypothetical protein